MSAGWFGLAGVLIGGFLNGWVSWLLARFDARANARVAALLVSDELKSSMGLLMFLKDRPVWGTLSLRSDLVKHETWNENRSALGHIVLRYVGTEGYLTVANAYDALLTLTDRARGESREADLTPEQRWAAGSAFLSLCRAISYLSLIIDLPPIWKPIALRRLKRDHRASVEAQVEQILALPAQRDFMAQFGGERPTH